MRRLVLVGGGHAHLFVLRAAASQRLTDTELVLVSPFPEHHYSGMVPGYLAGQYEASALAFDLVGWAGAAGARFVEGFATSISMAQRSVILADGERIPFDALSLDVGSAPGGVHLPGVAEHALSVRPMSRAVALRQALDTLPGPEARVAVVGGGAAGVEVALAVKARLSARGLRAQVTLVEAGPRVLAEYSEPVRRLAMGALNQGGVQLLTQTPVARLEAQWVVPQGDASPLPTDLVIWVAGASPPPLLAASDLPRDPAGFLRVDATLRGVDGSPVWGAGDCIALEGHPTMPRAGVYAVRQAPILAHNLLGSGPPRRYTPQPSFLALMNTADGQAILRWKGVALQSRWAWWLKDWIDRRFMARFQHPSA